MRKSTQRALFLLFVVILAAGVLWVIWQLPPTWRPWASGFVLFGVPLMLFIAHIMDRWQAIREAEAKRQPAPAPKPAPAGRPYRPSGSFQVRRVAEKRATKQRIV